jgi:hypothetical protein
MTDLELVFAMLGETSTTEIAKASNAVGFQENASAARSGGRVAGDARRDLERQTEAFRGVERQLPQRLAEERSGEAHQAHRVKILNATFRHYPARRIL